MLGKKGFLKHGKMVKADYEIKEEGSPVKGVICGGVKVRCVYEKKKEGNLTGSEKAGQEVPE